MPGLSAHLRSKRTKTELFAAGDKLYHAGPFNNPLTLDGEFFYPNYSWAKEDYGDRRGRKVYELQLTQNITLLDLTGFPNPQELDIILPSIDKRFATRPYYPIDGYIGEYVQATKGVGQFSGIKAHQIRFRCLTAAYLCKLGYDGFVAHLNNFERREILLHLPLKKGFIRTY